jgi:hypothetical protein
MMVLPTTGQAIMTSLHFRTRPGRIVLAAALAWGMLALPAMGQALAPQATPVVMPKPDCGTKPQHPGKLASENAQRQWRKAASTYLECYKTFASDQRALAQRYTDAANAVIDQYNAAAKEIQAAADAAAE